MEEIIKEYLINDAKLIKKYKKAEEKYIKSLNNKCEKVDIDLDFTFEEKNALFESLARSGICLDDLIASILKIEIVRREYSKHEKISEHTKNMADSSN